MAGGLGRERLRRPRVLARDVARRHGALFDRPDRLARHAIEHEREALLGQLHDGVDRPAVDANRDEVGRRRVVVVPQAVMHDLEVPLADAGRGVEAHQRFGEHVGARTAAAVEVVARRAERHVDEAARGVERHRRPRVGVAGVAPRVGAPRVVAELARLRNRPERPDLLAGVRVERADVARRIVAIHEAIADAVAENHQVLVDDRRRRVRVVRLVDFPDEPLAQIEHAVRAEAVDEAAGRGVEADQVVAAVDEDAQLVAVGAVAPRGDAAMHEAGAVGRLAVFVRFRIERPQLGAGVGVQRDDAVVGRAQVEHVVDHQRRRLEVAGARAERLERLLARRPLPRDAEPRHGGRVDVGQRRVFHPALIAAVKRPVLFTAGTVRLRLDTTDNGNSAGH